MSAPVVITAALTGVLATRDQCPAIPYTPQEIGEEAKRAADAGAAIVHIHARSPEGGPEWRVEGFAEILNEVSVIVLEPLEVGLHRCCTPALGG